MDNGGSGGSDELKITGADADTAVTELNQDSQLNLVRDQNTGKVTMADKSKIDYNTLTCEDQALYNIIEDTSKTVNLSTTQDMVRTNSAGKIQPFILGHYNGQNATDSFQEVNMIQAQNLEANGGQTAGTTVRHEIFEGASALSIVNTPVTTQTPNFVPPAFTANVYNQAHLQAVRMDSNFKLSNLGGNQVYYQQKPPTLWFNFNLNANASTPGDPGWFVLQK
ncbi:hypothetical protein CHU92_00010 [Flavobacterium cyanobacteriorum]|uniref:Uncharacterized protein n=1 Tax=Flavobacterium cyanobacteriorum TaxID=2022802 RepID=A0A256ACB2_9FLAO|nr:hypothetical protein CHU92_00010 [Flavobacterium cyanobacteriorum]